VNDEDDTSLFAQEVAGIKPLKKCESYLRKKGLRWTFHVVKQAASIAQEAPKKITSHTISLRGGTKRIVAWV